MSIQKTSKHYDSDYLSASAKFNKSIKEFSYSYFEKLKEGKILDLGCGNGIDVNNMAQRFNDNITIVGIDHDIEMINHAKKNTISKKVKFIHSEAENTPLNNDSVDGLRIERVMQHLSNPQGVINEAHRILRENSPLVILETDWHGITFYTNNILTEVKIQKYLVEEKIKNGLASRQIPSYLVDNNFKNIELKIFPILLSTLNEANELFKIEEIILEMESQNYLSKEDSEIFIEKLMRLDNMNCFSCSIDLVVYSAIK